MNELGLGDNAMYVERLLPAAREKLVTISGDAPLTEAAKFLHKGTDLVIVCGSAGLVAGVITKTDVVGQMNHCQGGSCTMAASLAMTRDVVVCRSNDLLKDVWKRMKERKLKKHSCRGPGFSATGSTSCAGYPAGPLGGVSRRRVDVARLCYGHRLLN